VALDERLRRELDRAAHPADPSGIYESLIRRRERRRIAQRVQSGLLAVVVLVGSVGGFYALTRIFRETEEPPPVASPTVSNGVIVFTLPLEDGGEHVFAVGADGSGLRQLTPEGRAVYRSPDVSPDGRTVVVVHEIPSFEPGLSVLAVVPIDGGPPVWLTEPHVFRDPAWSPDGSQIAFAGSVEDPFGISLLDVVSGDVRLIPGTDEISVGDPTWSPDGERIAFEASTDSDTDPGQRWDIYSVRLDGSELTNLSRTPDDSETWPAWSWSTDRIAFVRGGETPGVYTMTPNGSDEVLVIDELADPASPTWSPDGTMLAFSADTGQVYTVGEDGRDLRAVTGALGEPAWQAIPEDGIPAPTPTPTPTEKPQPEGEDIGLGFPVCNVSTVSGAFGTAATGTAFVATRAGDTGCPRLGDGFQLVAVDVSGDGLADASFGPLGCDDWCTAFAAPDVDGDGTDELMIQNIQFSIVGLRLYEVRSEPRPEVFPVTVATPGYPEGDLGPGAEPQLWIGGDGFNVDELQCATTPSGRVLVQTSATMVPPDAPDSVWQAAETTFALNTDGTVSVVGTRSFEEPVEEGGPSFWNFGDGICGARLSFPY
jgi:hypothetical protein